MDRVIELDTHGSSEESTGWLLLWARGIRVEERGSRLISERFLENPEVCFLYADHDVIDEKGTVHLTMRQPDWSAEHLRSKNYFGPAFAVRVDHADKVLGVAFGVGDASLEPVLEENIVKRGWHDLILRLTEGLDAKQIHHLDEVIFHFPKEWKNGVSKKIATSVKAIQEHLNRMGVAATAEEQPGGLCRVRYQLLEDPPMVSIIIPTRDQPDLLRRCLESILARSTYPHFEILVVDNGSVQPETLHFLESLQEQKKIRLLRHESPYNFSAINNHAAKEARGGILCLLNDDTEVISPDWIETMVGHLIQPGIGVVGAKLLFPDGRVQHAGDAVGPRGAADHLHSGVGATDPGYGDRAIVAQDLSAVTGACLMTWKNLYQQLGGLDATNLPVAYNDIDYCLRVRERGSRVVWTPHALLLHHELATRGINRRFPDFLSLWKAKRFVRRKWQIGKRPDPFYGKHFNQKKADFALRK